MTNGPGSAPTPTHWARVQVVAGNTGAGMWDLSSQLPEARVTVGSGQEAGWNVQGEGVQPVHFELYWDGKSLWVGPPLAGNLTVDGERVQAWRQLAGRCRLEFGRAAMMIESSQAIEVAGAPVAARPSPPQAPQVPAPVAPATGNLTSEAALPLGGLNDFADDDATAIYSGDPADLVPPPAGGGPAPTPIGGVVAPPSVSMGVPRLGTGVPAQLPQQRPAPPTVGFQMDDVTSRPVGEFKTQILDTESISQALPPLAAGAQAAPPVSGAGAGPVVEQRPTLMQSPASTDILPKEPEQRSFVGPGGSSFALPPIPSSEEGGDVEPGLKRPPQRTLILFAVVLVVALGALTMLMLKKRRARAAAAAAAATAQQQQTVQAQEIAERLRIQIQADRAAVLALQAAERARALGLVATDLETARAAALEALDSDATEEETAAAVKEAERVVIEGRGVTALMANRLPDALAFYEILAADYPTEQYSGTAVVLRAKLECRRSVRRDGTECTR